MACDLVGMMIEKKCVDGAVLVVVVDGGNRGIGSLSSGMRWSGRLRPVVVVADLIGLRIWNEWLW